MWNVISGNRLIDRRRKQEAQRRHITALNKIKPMVDNHTPQEYSFLYSRPKAYQKKQERQADIESQNTILIERMMRTTSQVRPKRQVLLKSSLNDNYRNRMSRLIDDGNQKLVKRLQSAKSMYCNVQKSMKEYQKYKSNMVYERMDPYYDLEYQTAPTNLKEQRQGRPISAKR